MVSLDHPVFKLLERTEKMATSEMYERETRKEKILEALNLNREIQLKQKSKGILNLCKSRKQKYSLADRKETAAEEAVVKVDPIAEAEKEFYRIIKEVKQTS